jgi:PadR family transcriptional regulator, regulatory protein PadR
MISVDSPIDIKPPRRRAAIDTWQSQLRKGSLDLAILASLWDGPLDRPQICCRLERMAGIELVQGVVYPILRRLRAARWIETQWVEVELGHPRQVYRLTEAGRESAKNLSCQWTKFADGMNRMLVTLSTLDLDCSMT